MAKTRRCPHCNETLAADAFKCSSCGVLLQSSGIPDVASDVSPEEVHQLCPNCSAKVRKRDIICPECGENLLTSPNLFEDDVPERWFIASRMWDAITESSVFVKAGAMIGVVGLVLLISWIIMLQPNELERGMAALEEKKLHEAEQLFAKAIERNIRNQIARTYLVKVLVKQGKYDAAIEEYKTFIKLWPDNQGAVFSLGLLQMRSKQYDDGVLSFRTFIENSPNNLEARNLLGLCHLMKNEYVLAQNQFEVSFEGDPSQINVRLYLGVAQFLGNKRDKAGATLAAALEVAPESIDIRTVSGLLELAGGDPEKGIQALKQTAKQGDGYSRHAGKYLALALAAESSMAEAISIFSSLDQSALQNPETMYYLGLCYLRSNRIDDAISILNDVVLRAPHLETTARYYLGLAYLAKGEPAIAQAGLASAAGANPANSDIQYALAMAHRDLGHVSEARGAFQKAVNLDPENPYPHLALGIFHAQTDNLRDAQGELSAYLKLSSQRGDAYSRVKDALRNLKDMKELDNS
ncbi:tetratricopeptide repeat protein [Candidatus Hydrogenedentota bacterium]